MRVLRSPGKVLAPCSSGSCHLRIPIQTLLPMLPRPLHEFNEAEKATAVAGALIDVQVRHTLTLRGRLSPTRPCCSSRSCARYADSAMTAV